MYFLQIVTPTDRIYSKINSVLFTEGVMLSLLTGTTAAIIVLVFLLRKWYSILQDEVTKRTRDLNESNYKLMKANESLKNKDEAQNKFINVLLMSFGLQYSLSLMLFTFSNPQI